MEFSRIKKKVFYHDTDCGGVVYYANYLKYFEEGRTVLLAEKGIDIKQITDDRGIFFVVRNTAVDYEAPGRYGDDLEVLTKMEEVKRASMIFYQEVRRRGKLLVSGKAVLVCIDENFRPVTIPKELKEKL